MAKVLIIGLGYAGRRFKKAFENTGTPVEFSYVGRTRQDVPIPYYRFIDEALEDFRPDVAVVTVPDLAHAEVLRALSGFDGFVLAEKPLVTSGDDLTPVESALRKVSGFCMDLVERYAETTMLLRDLVREDGLTLVRAHFTWGKDRINDHRPTSGVSSEIIHPLDLLQWICGAGTPMSLETVLGVRSDFSVSGHDVLDSVAISARLGSGVVSGYSSFVNITRKREIDFVFRDRSGDLLYANAVYDTPVWDADRLRVWRRTGAGDVVVHELDTGLRAVPKGAETVVKLGRMVDDVTRYVASGRDPNIPFAGLSDAFALQRLLNEMEARAYVTGPVSYFPNGRTVLEEVDWERLG
ncbi:Predicted dehydrogenase [Marinactinospora thermotolerans DSM 45154]|uniref:Predicted dehydrogenase n=1 Tax=Marinactinospora thermotolerans DSM 45154 TaxID=1122192 RepID=A0A1T4SU19_9ACTN|nr:Gfo/Idh/MocA family oxidoreductase [Marinactinospora thermotolerans]SKA31388.1 Predicted dehydrogenase [Marinactinospora thermotolerans DSM 45154]